LFGQAATCTLPTAETATAEHHDTKNRVKVKAATLVWRFVEPPIAITLGSDQSYDAAHFF
jgi:hypothetical protein